MQQYACSFEFNDTLLIELFQHVYSSKFGRSMWLSNESIMFEIDFISLLGTFLFNSEKEKTKYKAVTKTVSLWSYLNRPEILRTFLNPFYEPNSNVLWPSVAAQSIVCR
jgi:myotubularin-related protein 9